MKKQQPLAPKGGNDVVYTPDYLAKQIVQYFRPGGFVCEPCRGGGAFLRAFDNLEKIPLLWGDLTVAEPGVIRNVVSYEITDGEDFLASADGPGHPHWIITNPPWSQLRPFLIKSMEVADNVVFLCLVNAFFMKARQRDMKEHGFGMKEILFVDTPPPPWPQTGFSLGAVHIQRGYDGPVKHTWL